MFTGWLPEFEKEDLIPAVSLAGANESVRPEVSYGGVVYSNELSELCSEILSNGCWAPANIILK